MNHVFDMQKRIEELEKSTHHMMTMIDGIHVLVANLMPQNKMPADTSSLPSNVKQEQAQSYQAPKICESHAEYLAQSVANILRERDKQYDSQGGERSMAQIVSVFKSYTGHQLTEAQGWLFMDVLETVRAFQKKGYHHDSCQDKVSYSALMGEALKREWTGDNSFWSATK